MDLPAAIVGFLQNLSPVQVGIILLVCGAVFYFRRAGIAFSQLGFENRDRKSTRLNSSHTS